MTAVAALVPAPSVEVELAGAALEAWLADRYALDGPRCRLNLSSALGGQIAGPSGGSDDLAGGIDRTLLRVLRRTADVVLVGASSYRAGGWPAPTGRPLAVLTVSGDLTGAPLSRAADPLLVLCPPAAAARAAATAPAAEAIVVADGPAAALAALRARGLARVLCEGGGGVAAALLAAGLVDEFDQTIVPLLTAPGAPLLPAPVPPTPGRLIGLLRDGTDRLYARWSLSAPQRSR